MLHCAIFPKRSDNVRRVVAVNVGNELSELLESSEPDDDERRRRFSPSIFTLVRNFSADFDLDFFVVGAADTAGAVTTGTGGSGGGLPLRRGSSNGRFFMI